MSRPPRKTIHDLPGELLGEVLRLAGQPAREACMLATKRLSAAALSRAAWAGERLLLVHGLDWTAVEFVAEHRPRHLVVVDAVPDDVSWFLAQLDLAGATPFLRHFTVVNEGPVQRVPADLLDRLESHAPTLRTFTLRLLGGCEQPATLEWPLGPGAWPRLEAVEIQEEPFDQCWSDSDDGDDESCDDDDPRNLTVLFGDTGAARPATPAAAAAAAAFPALRRVAVSGDCSDVMAVAPTLPALRHLNYRYDHNAGGDDLDDADLGGCTFNFLKVCVSRDTDVRRLGAQLRRAARVRNLIVKSIDLDFLAITGLCPPGLERLAVEVPDQAIVVVDYTRFLEAFPTLRQLAMASGAGASAGTGVLRFSGVGDYADWGRTFGGRVRLVTDCCVTLY